MVWVETAKGLYEPVHRAEIDEETLNGRIRLSNLPPGTRLTHRFATFEHRQGLVDALITAQKFALMDPLHHFLTLTGERGVGKTHLAIAILWTWLEEGLGNGAYWQVEAMLEHLRSYYKQSQRYTESDIDTELNWLKNCGLLVLDDLGVEKETEWATAKLDEIVDHRYLHKRRTVFTTNVKSEELPPRIVDRIFEGKVLTLKAPSYRRLNKGERSK